MPEAVTDLRSLNVQELEEEEAVGQIDEYDIVASPNDFNTLTINNFIEEGAIKIPPFQRNYVWDRKRASKLIESLILGLPVPQVFLYEEGRNNFLVIDGQQRLLTVFFFAKQRFPRNDKRAILRNLFNTEGGISDDVLADDELFENFKLSLPSVAGRPKNKFSGLTYGKLGDYRRQLDLRTIRNVIVKQVSPADDDSAMFEMFNRLNTGGVNLNPQEIRASLYHSKFFDSVFLMNQVPTWRALLDAEQPDSRMKDMEVILRSLALREGTESYAGSMAGFVNRFCKRSKVFAKDKITQTMEEWSWFMRLNENAAADTYKAGSSRFSPLLFEAVYASALMLRDQGEELPHISPNWVTQIGKNQTFTSYQQEGSTKTANVRGRIEITQALLLQAAKGTL
ncbi:GmrSD restriction endonuclease domain-containing protein [Streptomyces lichenis]|uniref:DUF262 domain-containing protein n=1 Tax=Streptomyces lichenis TaxID=2306967 RepID=A0ABT0I554_9ACTN|nr:DUF262 domain-containing protein [Streptomyces lichenis]MCK8676407.1 DUF262 domain-containing protein [Streptomyces lichenis]